MTDPATAQTPRQLTYDVPSVLTVYMTGDEPAARETLVGALNFGLLLDVDAGDGIFIHQASTLSGRPPVLFAIDDESPEDDDLPGGDLPGGDLPGGDLPGGDAPGEPAEAVAVGIPDTDTADSDSATKRAGDMTLSQLISELTALRDQHGNEPVRVAGGRFLRSVSVRQARRGRHVVVLHQQPLLSYHPWDGIVSCDKAMVGTISLDSGRYVAQWWHDANRIGDAATAMEALELFDRDHNACPANHREY